MVNTGRCSGLEVKMEMTMLDFLFGMEERKEGYTEQEANGGYSEVILRDNVREDEKERTKKELTRIFRHQVETYGEAELCGESPVGNKDIPEEDKHVRSEVADRRDGVEGQGDLLAGFDRDSVRTEAIRRSMEAEEVEESVEELSEGYMPPLPIGYIPNMQLALDDCAFSMFIGEICEADDRKKYEIYFMVAPFELRENEPSCNILMYAFFKNQNYSVTSPLTNGLKNSILCQIAEFQFLVRGSFRDGVWSSEIQLTGSSLRRKDIFDIKKSFHHNPKHPGGNGHIRFTYEGYINHKEITSVGSIDVFPMDIKGETFIVVRCMEDFVDIFYTDDAVPIELKTTEGKKVLSIFKKDGIVTAELKSFGEEADGE